MERGCAIALEGLQSESPIVEMEPTSNPPKRIFEQKHANSSQHDDTFDIFQEPLSSSSEDEGFVPLSLRDRWLALVGDGKRKL